MNDTTTKLSGIEAQLNKTLSSNAISKIIKQIEAALSELETMDTLLAEIKTINSALSQAGLEKIMDDAFSVAGKYGKSPSGYLTSLMEAMRAGYQNAEAIAQLSAATQTAGHMTAELADRYIFATDKAYALGGSVEKLRDILDGTNAIADNNALNMTELAEGMSIAGRTAAEMGISAKETAAAIATMMAATGKNGTETATAFLSIVSNIRQIASHAGMEELLSPMETLRELSKTDILSSLSALPDINGDQAAGDALRALLENYPRYESMLQQYADGRGSMEAEAEKIADSWEASLNRLSGTWTETIGNLADTGAITAAIDGINSLLTAVEHITDTLGPAGSIAALSGGILGAKNVGRLKKEA